MANSNFTTEELNNEIWLPVVGYEGVYSVSNLGRVRRDTKTAAKPAGYILKQHVTRGDYLRVYLLGGKRGLVKPHSPHRLVAKAFLGLPEPRRNCVNHIDANRQNNRVENLQWVSYFENSRHMVEVTETSAKGSANGAAKLHESDVYQIKIFLAAGYACVDIARQYNVTPTAIQYIKQGKSWTHVKIKGEALLKKCPTCHQVIKPSLLSGL